MLVAGDVAKEDFFASMAGKYAVNIKTIKWKNPEETRRFADFLGGH